MKHFLAYSKIIISYNNTYVHAVLAKKNNVRKKYIIYTSVLHIQKFIKHDGYIFKKHKNLKFADM